MAPPDRTEAKRPKFSGEPALWATFLTRFVGYALLCIKGVDTLHALEDDDKTTWYPVHEHTGTGKAYRYEPDDEEAFDDVYNGHIYSMISRTGARREVTQHFSRASKPCGIVKSAAATPTSPPTATNAKRLPPPRNASLTNSSKHVSAIHWAAASSSALYLDNESNVHNMFNLSGANTQHLNKRLAYSRDVVQRKLVRPKSVSGKHNCADVLTKSLPTPDFLKHADFLLGITHARSFH